MDKLKRVENDAKRYAASKAAGICFSHSNQPLMPGKSKCKKCEKNHATTKNVRYNVRKLLGVCVFHKDRLAVTKTQCKECVEDRKIKGKERCAKREVLGLCVKHPFRKAESKLYCQECLDRRKAYYEAKKQLVFRMIFETHGVEGCQYMIHPHMPEELKDRKCWGRLWFEHPNGGGGKDEKANGRLAILNGVASGNRDPKDYMVLCQLHQIWNNYGRINTEEQEDVRVESFVALSTHAIATD